MVRLGLLVAVWCFWRRGGELAEQEGERRCWVAQKGRNAVPIGAPELGKEAPELGEVQARSPSLVASRNDLAGDEERRGRRRFGKDGEKRWKERKKRKKREGREKKMFSGITC